LNYLEGQIIGKGVSLRSEPINRDGKVDLEAKRIIETAWRDWGKPENCEVTGRYSYADIQKLMLRSRKRDGEGLIRIVFDSRWKYGFKLQILETDVLDYELNTQLRAGNRIRMGVELDSRDKPVAYWVFSQNPNAQQLRPGFRHERIPAKKFIHNYKTTRMGQVRGICEFASVMPDLKMLDAYDEAELVAARAAACVMYEISPPPGVEFGGDLPDSANGSIMFNAQPGQVHNGKYGSLKPVSIQHPTTAFKDMRNGILRKVSAGFDVAFDSLTNDITEANFSNSRLGKLAERDGFINDQELQITQVDEPIFDIFLNRGLSQGFLDPLPANQFEKFEKHEFVARRWPFADPSKDLDALIKRRKQGWISDEFAISQTEGGQVEDVYAQIKSNTDMAEALGLQFGEKQLNETFTDQSPEDNSEETQAMLEEGREYDIAGQTFVYKDGSLQPINEA